MIAGLLVALCAVAAPQDLKLRVASVHGTPKAAEIVVRDGRLVAPGQVVADEVETIRLPGGHAYPGLIDAHAHLLGLGDALETVDLVGMSSYDALIAAVARRAAEMPDGEWILGRGWDQNRWPGGEFPTHHDLSVAVPDHPVFLTRVDGHAALANARALREAGIDAETRSPSGGEILAADGGEPTGVLIDRAMDLVARRLPEPDDAALRRRLLVAQRACLAAGLTGVHAAGMSPAAVDVLRALHAAGEWQLRVYVMLPGSAAAAIEAGPWQTPDGVVTVRAVKSYADGALGSRGAALLAPYSDRSHHRGLLLASGKQVERLAQTCADRGFQLCVHAIGDKANRIVLDAYAATRFKTSRRAARFRIEHAQVVAEADFARFVELDVIPSMQPTHLTSDMPWAVERLGKERIRGAYAWRRFLALGLPVPFGSDFPVESHDPRLGLFAATTTRRPGTKEELRPDQKLSRAEALRGFTEHAAFAAFQERDLGSLASGKLADITVFDRDLLQCPEDELLSARVLLTVIGGRVVYRGEEPK